LSSGNFFLKVHGPECLGGLPLKLVHIRWVYRGFRQYASHQKWRSNKWTAKKRFLSGPK